MLLADYAWMLNTSRDFEIKKELLIGKIYETAIRKEKVLKELTDEGAAKLERGNLMPASINNKTVPGFPVMVMLIDGDTAEIITHLITEDEVFGNPEDVDKQWLA